MKSRHLYWILIPMAPFIGVFEIAFSSIQSFLQIRARIYFKHLDRITQLLAFSFTDLSDELVCTLLGTTAVTLYIMKAMLLSVVIFRCFFYSTDQSLPRLMKRLLLSPAIYCSFYWWCFQSVKQQFQKCSIPPVTEWCIDSDFVCTVILQFM